MKSLLALTLAVSAAIAASAPRHTLTPNYYDHLEAEAPVHRTKRASGFKSACPAGWTGQFCESPLCSDQQEEVEPQEDDLEKTLDVLYLPSACAGEYYVPYDSTTSLLIITVTTDANTRATAILTGPTGNTPNSISTEYSGNTATYRFVAKPNPYVLTFTMNAHSDTCIVRIQARSSITFSTGWVETPQTSISTYGQAAYSSNPEYFIAHPFKLVSPSEVKTVTIRQYRNLQPEYRSLLSRRYGCAYEYYAGQFQCTPGRIYLQQIEGVDAQGFAFRRTREFSCIAGTKPTELPPTDVPVANCQNGGSLLYNNETETNFCFCSELTTGKDCGELLCMNGGIPADEKKDSCDCLPGFVGRNCDNVVCDPDVGKLLTDTKTLAVVIRNTKSMAQHIDNILDAIDEEIVNHVNDGRTVYDGFILTYERNGVVYAKSYAMNKFANFGLDIENLKTTYSSDVSCTESLVPAIEAVYSQNIKDQSPIFIFTDAAPEPTDGDQFKDLMRLNAANRMQLHTVFMKTQANCKANPNIKFYNDLARYTAGLVHQPPADKLSKTFQNAMRGTTYHMNLVESADLKSCSMKTKSFIVDYKSENVIIIATGTNVRIALTDPDWNNGYLDDFYNDGTSYFFIISPSSNHFKIRGGEWLYAVQGDEEDNFAAPCSYRIYSQADFDLFLGTTTDVNIDERTFEPVVGQPAHLIAQVNGFYGGYVQDQFRLFSEILITSPDEDDKHQPLYYSNGIFRSSCGFHLYFGVADFCRTEDQIFYATVFVDDDMGFPVQRSAVGYCNGADTPVNPGDGDCQNGGVRVNETTCWCPTHFSGATCTVPECLHGGQLNQAQTACECPSGVTGTFCEQMECTTKVDSWEATTEHRTLNFVLSTRHSMKNTVKALADGAATFAGYYQNNHKTWIDHFAIVTVNSSSVDLHITNSPQEFADTFRMISNNFDSYTDPSDDTCTVLINKGINAALSPAYANSYIFVFADSQSEEMAFPDLLNLLDRADEMHNTVTLIGTDLDMCDGNGTFGEQEQSVVAFTGGKTFYVDKVDRVFDYIDTFYSSGVVFEATYDNCNNKVKVDFPLEASAHSVVVTVEGKTPTLDMSSPDEQIGLYHDPLFEGRDFTIQQYLQACPSLWDTKDNMCYLWNTEEVQWITSLVGCGSMDKQKGASLVTIFDDKKHDEVKDELHQAQEGVWLALYRDSVSQKWQWMQTGSNPIPLDPSLNKYFAPGEDMYDLSKQYAYMKSDGFWYLDDVTGRHWTLCQRDRYGRSYNPEASEPDLPPGFWHLEVSSTSATCSVQVRVQSDLQVFFGFSQDPHVDFKRGTANVDSTTNYVVAKAVGLDGFDVNPDIPEGRIDYATIQADGKDYFPLAMTQRAPDTCTFDSVSKISFACPTQQPLSEVVVKFQGIDQFGYSFERSLVSRCDTYAVRCLNGGFANNGECVCPPHYNGDDCSVPMCENGGTTIFDGSCACPSLFDGQFCSLPKCDPPYPGNFQRNQRTLVIAVETSFTMSTSIFYLSNYLVDSLEKLTQKRPDWFDYFVLIPFDSTSNKASWYPSKATIDFHDFDAVLDAIPTGECPGDPSCSDPNCPRPIGQLLLDALSDNDAMQNPDSTIVVITNSAIEDHNLSNDIRDKLIETKAQLHFVIAPSASPCNLGWDDEMNKAMQYFASFSVGTVSSVVPKQLGNYFSEFLPTMYKAQEIVIDSQYIKDCSKKEHVFQVDHSTNEFNLQFFGVETETISMTGPLGPVDIPPNILPGASTYFGVFQVDNQVIVPGTYIVRSNSTGMSCDLKVRASTEILIDIGFTQVHDTVGGNSQDDAHFTGLFGVQNKAMFHVEGMEVGGALQYVQIVNPRGDVIATRDVMRRVKDCTYTFVMDGTFSCDYQDLEVVVYGVDWQNSPFHRNFRVHCTDTRPQPIPPIPNCDLGAMRADIAFLVDTSVDQTTINFFQLFMASMMSPKMTLGRDIAQFGAMSLSDAPEQGGYFSFRFGSDKNTMINLIDSIKADGHAGQNITSAIPALMRDMYTKNNGYRGQDKSVKKLLIYLTASNPTDDEPDNAFNALISDKVTGVAVASFRVANPSTKLKSLAEPHCFYDSGASGNSFNAYGVRFMQNLLCSEQPVCGMPGFD